MQTEYPFPHKTSTLTNAQGMRIFYQHWQPETGHKVNLFIAHGIGEHSGRYRHVVNYLVPKGFTIIAPDHQGHGKSQGKRGHVGHFTNFAQDLELLRQATLEIQDNKPTFILGHSLGGLIVMDYLMNYDQNNFAGVVFSSPAFGIKVPVAPWKQLMAKLLLKIAPSLTMSNGIDPDDLSRDRDEVEQYIKDEMVHDQASVALFTSMQQVMQKAKENAAKIIIPVLLMLGENDKVISQKDALGLFSLLGSKNKKQYICSISNHELFNEIDRTHNIEEMWSWINVILEKSS